MKKIESTWYNMVIVLTLIAVCAGAALAYVNHLTEGPIKEIAEANEAAAIKAVLCTDDVVITDTITIGEGKDAATVYLTDKGAAVKTSDPGNKSFGGGLSIMVGLDCEFHVLGYSVLTSNETPGLGAKAGEWFQKEGKGNIIGKTAGKLAVSKDGGEVDAITASTITSRAFLAAVNNAYVAFSVAQGKEVDAHCASSSTKHNNRKEENHE
ncbi:MAG: RnfABCDGE type electron transport complex subunit G [Bacteroidaceae bacterium]|nr:RnfABCDGE type electron transport complex subunit G [Bacteroidaceae bacterium]